MENEQYKPIRLSTSGTSQSLSHLIKEYEDKEVVVVVMGVGEEPSAFIKRAMKENGPCVVVIEDVDLILKGKNLNDELDVLKNPPFLIKNYHGNIEPLKQMFVQDKKKPWESIKKRGKLKKGGR